MADERITDLTLVSSVPSTARFEFADPSNTSDPISGSASGANLQIGRDDLAAAVLAGYAGSASIVTVGTIAAGVWSGTAVGPAAGGTGLSALPSANQVLGVNAGASAFEGKTLTAGSGITITPAPGVLTIAATGGGGGGGTVTSVGLVVPTWLAVTGSPVTTSGNLTVAAAAGQTANRVLATPDGSAGAVSLRALSAADLPVMVASGASHAAGIAPDPGASAGSTKFLREDATWAVPAGGGGGYATVQDEGSALTQRAILNFTGPNVTAVDNSGSNRTDVTIGSRTPILAVTVPNASKVTGVTPTSLLAGVTYLGSRDIPANRLIAGSCLMMQFYGELDCAISESLTISVKLGATTILTGTTGTASAPVTGRQWMFDRMLFGVRTGGASGTGGAMGVITVANTALNTTFFCYLSGPGGGAASTGVTLDMTGVLTLDIVANFLSGSASNGIRILGGAVWIDG